MVCFDLKVSGSLRMGEGIGNLRGLSKGRVSPWIFWNRDALRRCGVKKLAVVGLSLLSNMF